MGHHLHHIHTHGSSELNVQEEPLMVYFQIHKHFELEVVQVESIDFVIHHDAMVSAVECKIK